MKGGFAQTDQRPRQRRISGIDTGVLRKLGLRKNEGDVDYARVADAMNMLRHISTWTLLVFALGTSLAVAQEDQPAPKTKAARCPSFQYCCGRCAWSRRVTMGEALHEERADGKQANLPRPARGARRRDWYRAGHRCRAQRRRRGQAEPGGRSDDHLFTGRPRRRRRSRSMIVNRSRCAISSASTGVVRLKWN